MTGEKTEQPTQKRLDDKRKEGQVPQRKNVVEATYLAISVSILAALSGTIFKTLIDILTSATNAIPLDFTTGLGTVIAAASPILSMLLGFCAGGTIFVLLFGLLLNRFNFAPKSLSPKFQKLNPVSGLKNMFSKSTFYNFVRLLVYFSILSVILYYSIDLNIKESVRYAYCNNFCISQFFLSLIAIVVFLILLVLAILAAIDFRIQTALFRSQNKMTKDEVKREYKTQEGDPQIKGARRSRANEDATLPGPKDVTHVVYGDTLLVAFIYREEQQAPPYVVAKVKGPHAPQVADKFRARRKAVVNLPAVAFDFFQMAKPYHYMPPRAADGMAKILQALS